MKTTKNSKTVLLITHVIPYPPSAGNEIRILKLLKWFKSEGYQVVLLLNVKSLEAHILTSLQQLVDAVYIPQDYLSNKTILPLQTKIKHEIIKLIPQ